MKIKGKNKRFKTLKDLKPKVIESESKNKPLINKGIYDKKLDERMDEILEISREINHNNLVYHFKGPSRSISSTEFGGPMYTFD